MPITLDRGHQTVLALVGTFSGLIAPIGQILLKSIDIPVRVGSRDLGIPILLDDLLEILTVGGTRIRDVMIGQPTLKFSLMPFIIG